MWKGERTRESITNNILGLYFICHGFVGGYCNKLSKLSYGFNFPFHTTKLSAWGFLMTSSCLLIQTNHGARGHFHLMVPTCSFLSLLNHRVGESAPTGRAQGREAEFVQLKGSGSEWQTDVEELHPVARRRTEVKGRRRLRWQHLPPFLRLASPRALSCLYHKSHFN